MSFLKFFLSRDMLGHPITINYMGEDTYKTKMGASLSIVVQVMVLIFLTMKIIALIEMSDPQTSIQERPIYESELDEYGAINLNEQRFNLGVYFQDPIDSQYIQIPPEVGRIVQI